MTSTPDPVCSVCGEAVDERSSAVCGECGRPFHLNQRNDVEGKNCGAVWIDEEFLALRFACFNCLPGGGGKPEPPVGKGH